MVVSGEGNSGSGAFRVPFVSQDGRDGLVVDILLSPRSVQNPAASPLSANFTGLHFYNVSLPYTHTVQNNTINI
jgi:hypothetical protein